MTTTTQKVPFHRLPLARERLQNRLAQLELADQPSAQRRSTTFTPSTQGIWARNEPLWTGWPLRITKEEVAEMGVDLSKGQQVNVEDVLRRWDVVDYEPSEGDGTGNGLRLGSSKHRMKLEPVLLGVSGNTLEDCLPHLDVGDAVEICNKGEPASSDAAKQKARESLIDVLSGRKILSSSEDSPDKAYGPWSTRYCGHQFGQWAGQLGDGRAISLMETESEHGGRQEIQLKGAGRTPFSRTADGLAVLRSGVREYLGCEAVAALGIPTTRALAILTHDPSIPVIRENGVEPPSLVARIAPSFIRIGHFEALNPGKAARNLRQIYFGGNWLDEGKDAEAAKGPLGGEGNLEGLRDLTEWCIGIMGTTGGSEGWVREVIKRNAEMVAGWQVYGWMHGVLNSDNISVLGLTIDFGPYAFMDVWDEGHICNHSDPSGLYSYRAQPSRVLWDLEKLVSALYPLIGYEANNGPAKKGWSEGATEEDVEDWIHKGKEVMKGFEDDFYSVERKGETSGWMKRFGLRTHQESDDRTIYYNFLTHLHTHSLDFHTSLRQLCAFRPSLALDSDKGTSYIDTFLDDFLAATLTRSTSEKVAYAKRDLSDWLSSYAGRVVSEQDAWSTADVSREAKGVKLDEIVGGEEWEKKRQAEMLRVNPRFVLRQWVLEELIAKLEESGVENIEKGRKDLAKILEMSTNPFRPWGESDPTSEDARLCGLGSKEMLGFQCSCSS